MTCYLTISTGQWECAITRCVTLPTIAPIKAPWPLVPMITKSNPPLISSKVPPAAFPGTYFFDKGTSLTSMFFNVFCKANSPFLLISSGLMIILYIHGNLPPIIDLFTFYVNNLIINKGYYCLQFVSIRLRYSHNQYCV